MKSWKITLTDLKPQLTWCVNDCHLLNRKLLVLGFMTPLNLMKRTRGMAPGGPAGNCLLFPGMVARQYKYKCSLPAQFPMKSVDTAAIDGVGLVPARLAIVGKLRAQRFAVPSMRPSPETVLR
jgi:hypothetical protein